MMPTAACRWTALLRGTLLTCIWLCSAVLSCKHLDSTLAPRDTFPARDPRPGGSKVTRCSNRQSTTLIDENTTTAPSALELRWIPGAIHVSINVEKWVLQSETGVLVPFACSSSDGLLAPVSCVPSRVTYSPSGSRALVLVGQSFFVGPSEGPFGDRTSVPMWADVSAAGTQFDLVAFWLSEHEVFFQDALTFSSPVCRVYDLETRRWRKGPKGCLQGSYSQLGTIQAGPSGLLAVYSGAEGMGSVEIERFDLNSGQRRTSVPALMLNVSPVTVRFAPNGSYVDVITACRIAPIGAEGIDLPCDEAAPWMLFSASLRDGHFELRRSDLPPGTVMDPTQDRFAWPRGREVCIGDPRELNPRCFATSCGSSNTLGAGAPNENGSPRSADAGMPTN